MVNYNLGKIYKIEAINGEDGDIYIGSTAKQYLSQRLDTHRSSYKQWLNGKHNKTSSYDLFDKYGLENCSIVLIESVNANSNDELKAREAYYIKSLNCVNKRIEGRTQKEWYNDNKERIQERQKEYRNNNKERIQERQNRQCTCICGSCYTHWHKSRHEKSLKHQSYINSQTQN